MNKQEKEELITFVNRAKEDLNFSFGICQKTYYGYVQGNKLINYIEQLNESEENLASTIKLLTNLDPDDFLKELKLYGLAKEPQKVKVPKCVGELLDYYRNSTDVDLLALLITFKDWYRRKDKAGENENAIDWLVKHPEKYMRAWLDGYEVEEDPKWKIINDQKYCLTSIEAGYGNSLHWAFDSTKKRPILFDNEETAMYTAYITGGIVEKVEV